ncbi:MAG TPA: methyltransferase domain-containing protein [Burkholderiaceae bacterium]|jgi:tRNA (cmo5U34)-methyltransferase|nr:methyltransferase domain-containing protein [Burkholderiaceae bacterium]
MIDAPKPFDPVDYFDESVAVRYDQGIRLSCPSYDALQLSMVPWLQLLPEKSTFLSAGAGTGTEVINLGKRFPSWNFVAVDVSADMLKVCQRRIAQADLVSRVEIFQGRIEEYESRERFEAASSIFVVHFIAGRDERLAYFRSIASKLKPGGVFVLADLYGDRGSPEFVPLLQAWLLHYVSHGATAEKLTKDLEHIFRNIVFSPESEVIALLHEAGFTGIVRFFQTFLFGGWVATRQG